MNNLLSGTIRSRLILFAAILMVFSGTPSTSAVPENKGEESPLEITSSRMIAEDSSKTITFIGSVIAKKKDITLTCDTMIVHYKSERKIDNVVAEGNVKMVQENKNISSEKAEYYPDQDMVIFTGSPEFNENGNTIRGSKITYFISSQRSTVEDSKVILK